MEIPNHAEDVNFKTILLTTECQSSAAKDVWKTEKPKLEWLFWYCAVWHFLAGNGENQGDKPV